MTVTYYLCATLELIWIWIWYIPICVMPFSFFLPNEQWFSCYLSTKRNTMNMLNNRSNCIAFCFEIFNTVNMVKKLHCFWFSFKQKFILWIHQLPKLICFFCLLLSTWLLILANLIFMHGILLPQSWSPNDFNCDIL